jgi:hypothetical protein
MATSAPATTDTTPPKSEIRIVSHSNLFYWWPVWAVGFLMAILTWFDGHLLTTVPHGSERGVQASGELTFAKPLTRDNTEKRPLQGQDVVFAPKGTEINAPRLHMARSKSPGVLFCIVLLLVVAITNIPMRGLWSVMVIITIVLLAVIFALMGVWDRILQGFYFLDIRINMGGYLLISTVLFIMWLFAFLFFDQQIYMVFTPGQFRVCQEIGGGEKIHDTTNMTVQKQRSDLFRHWILGLGSGDLIVTTSDRQHFDLPNVLFLGRRIREIEGMLRQRQIVAAVPKA